MHPTRRDILTQSIGLGGAMALSQLLPVARASSAVPTDPHRRFVFVYFPGGWDSIISLDPKDPEVYDDSSETIYETGVQTGYRDLGFSEDPRIFTDVEGIPLARLELDQTRLQELLEVISSRCGQRGCVVRLVQVPGLDPRREVRDEVLSAERRREERRQG